MNSHNNYVELFSQGGVLGLGLFFWFWAEVIRIRVYDSAGARFADGFSGGYVNAMLAAWIGAMLVMLFADWILPFVYNIGFPRLPGQRIGLALPGWAGCAGTDAARQDR